MKMQLSSIIGSRQAVDRNDIESQHEPKVGNRTQQTDDTMEISYTSTKPRSFFPCKLESLITRFIYLANVEDTQNREMVLVEDPMYACEKCEITFAINRDAVKITRKVQLHTLHPVQPAQA